MILGPWIERFALTLAFVSALAILALSNSSLTRAAVLSHSNSCQLRLQMGLTEATRMAIIGSSRIREAIDPDHFAEAMGMHTDGVVNLAHPQIGPGYDFGVISAITGDVGLEVVVVEVIARSEELRAAERVIDPAPDLIVADLAMGSVRQSFLLGVSLQDQARRAFQDAPNMSLALSDFLSLVSQRITATIALLNTRQIYPRLFREEGRIDPDRSMMCAIRSSRDATLVSDGQRMTQSAKIAGYRKQFADGNWADPNPLGYLVQAGFAFDRGTVRDMIALGERRGVRVVFLYVPGIHVPVDDGLSNAFAEYFGAPLQIPPPDLRRQLANGGYYDNVHLNEVGSRFLVTWLASVFAAQGWVPDP